MNQAKPAFSGRRLKYPTFISAFLWLVENGGGDILSTSLFNALYRELPK